MPACSASEALAASASVEEAAVPGGIAHQSDMTKPRKPKSSRKISLRRCLFGVAFLPLTRLYEAMMQAAPRAMGAGNEVDQPFLPAGSCAARLTPRGPSRKLKPRMPLVLLSRVRKMSE